MKSIIIALTIAAFTQGAPAQVSKEMSDFDRVAVFAILQEAKASDFAKRDVCVGVGNGLQVNGDAVISELKHVGLNACSSNWCVAHQRGLNVGIIGSLNEAPSDTFSATIEVGDASIKPGEHFATLLKRGTYVIRFVKGYDPQLTSYRQTCCDKKN